MVYLNNISLVLPKKWEGKESACAGNWVSVIKCCMSLKYNVGGPLKHILCMENTDVTSPSSLKLVTAPFFNITFFYFLVCRFFRHPASRWLRYTGCLLSFRLKESLSPPDLVSLRSVVQGWKNVELTSGGGGKTDPQCMRSRGRIRSKWVENSSRQRQMEEIYCLSSEHIKSTWCQPFCMCWSSPRHSWNKNMIYECIHNIHIHMNITGSFSRSAALCTYLF